MCLNKKPVSVVADASGAEPTNAIVSQNEENVITKRNAKKHKTQTIIKGKTAAEFDDELRSLRASELTYVETGTPTAEQEAIQVAYMEAKSS